MVSCQGSLDRRVYVAPEATQPNVVFLTGVGHGVADTYTGDMYDPILSVGAYDPAEVAGKVIHFLSCDTALTLGPDVVANGCRAFFGYDTVLIYPPEEEATVLECDSEIDRAFADGLTAQQVYQRVRDLFDKRIGERQGAGAWYAASALATIRDHLRAPSVGAQWGSPGATIL